MPRKLSAQEEAPSIVYYMPTDEDVELLGLKLEKPEDPYKPGRAWLEGTRDFVKKDTDGRKVLRVYTQYENLVDLYTTSAEMQSTSRRYYGVLPSREFFIELVKAINWI